MSAPLQLGDRQLVSLKEATNLVPYSRDYIARLAREAKIVAAQYNRQWYIDAVSLQNFYETAQLEVRARQEYVRELRRQELSSHETLQAVRRRLELESFARAKRSAVASMQIFILGLAVGLCIFLGSTRLSVHYVPGQTASLMDFFSWGDVTTPVTTSTPWYETGLIIDETKSIKMDNGIILLPPESSSTLPADVATMFSDGVEVTEVSSSTGEVRLNDSPTTTMQFVRIPGGATTKPVKK